MTAPEPDVDPVRAFRRALGPALDRQLNTTQAVTALVHAAVTNHNWTPKQLAQECGRDLHNTINAGAVITDRLRKAATRPPAVERPAFGPAVPFCTPDCATRSGWLEDDNGDLTGRCPCRTPQEANAS